MVRAYSLYVDVPAKDWERIRKTAVLGVGIVAHLLLIGWMLRTPLPMQKDSSSMVVVLLNALRYSPSPLPRHSPRAKAGTDDPGNATIPRHSDATRARQAAKPAVVEATIVVGPRDSDTGNIAGASGNASDTGSGTRGGTHVSFVPPRVLKRWKRPYPIDAYEERAEGETHVLVTIAPDGSLKDASIDKSSGSASLDRASLDTVSHYEFRAAARGGLRIEAQAIVTVDWSIGPAVSFGSPREPVTERRSLSTQNP